MLTLLRQFPLTLALARDKYPQTTNPSRTSSSLEGDESDEEMETPSIADQISSRTRAYKTEQIII